MEERGRIATRAHSRIAPLVLVCQIAVAVCIALDLALSTRLAELSLVRVARALLVAAGLAGPIGLVLGLAMGLWPVRRKATLSAPVALATSVALLAWVVLCSGVMVQAVRRFHDPSLIAWLLVAACLAALVPAVFVFAVTRRVLRALASSRTWMVQPDVLWWCVPVGAVAVLWAALRFLGAHLSMPERIRGLLLVNVGAVVLLAGLRALRSRTARSSARAVCLWALGCAILFGTTWSPLGDDPFVQRGLVVPAWTRLLRPILDRDGDGFISILGHGDCEESNARRSPRAVEIVGNGIDEDCRYGDMVAGRAAPEPTDAGAQTTVLVTLSGLGVSADGTWAPPLPAVRRRMAKGTLFERPYGVEGSFEDLFALLTTGRIARQFETGGRGSPSPILNVARLVERARGRAWLAVPASVRIGEMSKLFRHERTARLRGGSAVGHIDRLRSNLDTGRSFAMVHADVTAGNVEEIDEALDRFLAAVGRRGSYGVLLVGLGSPGRSACPSSPRPHELSPSGPLALLRDGARSERVRVPVGLFDVYPTLLELSGLAEPDSSSLGAVPLAGSSLMRLPTERSDPRRRSSRPVLSGWLSERPLIVSTDGTVVVRSLPLSRRFELRDSGSARAVPEDARAAAGEPLALLRDRFLAPRLAANNRALAAALPPAVPGSLAGNPARIGGLDVLGCTKRPGDNETVEITVYLRFGERLRPGDRLVLMLKGPTGSGARVVTEPVDGLLPFGAWTQGALLANKLVFDRRLVSAGPAYLRAAVSRDGRRLPVLSGEGVVEKTAIVCSFAGLAR